MVLGGLQVERFLEASFVNIASILVEWRQQHDVIAGYEARMPSVSICSDPCFPSK